MDRLKKTQAYQVFMAFQLQEICALLFLVNKNYEKYELIEIETNDDVCLNGNGKLLCQIKRVSAQDKRITNASIDLWKTLYNWMMFYKENTINLSDELLFIVECDINPKKSDLIYILDNASTIKEIDSLYNELYMWYNNHYIINKEKEPEVKAFLDEIFNDGNKEFTKQVFTKFKLMKHKVNYFEELYSLLRRDYEIPEIMIEDLADKTISWFKRNITSCNPISIERSKYRDMIRKYIENNTFTAKLISQNIKVDKAEIEETRTKNPLFIKELLEVHSCDDEIINAIDFFIKTKLNRQHYVLTNQLNDDDLSNYDDSLVYYWSNQKGKVCVLNKSVLDKSKLLKYTCLDLEKQISNYYTPFYFTAGSYHHLVNNKKIHWYLKELENED